jgi:secreted trypsin-like serine protease
VSLAAAHCFENKHRRPDDIKTSANITVWVGKHNLDKAEENAVEHGVSQLFIHEDWKHDEPDFDADIAMAVLINEVDLSRRFIVGVICLPQASNRSVDGMGVIAGWGMSERSIAENEDHDSKPNHLVLPAISNLRCFNTDYRLCVISSDRTFCGGFVNQTKSACNGDSGGGFVQYDESKRSFELVGIISSSIKDTVGECNKELYSIFTDVRKFLGWITDKMEGSNNVVTTVRLENRRPEIIYFPYEPVYQSPENQERISKRSMNTNEESIFKCLIFLSISVPNIQESR